MTSDPSGVERHRGREAALQLLYQWEVGRLDRSGLDDAIEFYWTVHPGPEERQAFARSLVIGTIEHVAEIDPLLEANTKNWRLSRLAMIDRLIMRMAVYELLYSDTPAAVVIDEALELARTYGGEQTVPFVNGVLDSIHRTREQRTTSSDT
jgi:N utilization substance protein B